MLRNPLQLIALLILTAALPSAVGKGRLMQGPMITSIEPERIAVWARAAGECVVNIRYSGHHNFLNAEITPPAFATAENDYCVTLEIEGLESNSFYYYQVLVNGEPADYDGYPVLTAPDKDLRTRFSIGFGSGARVSEDGLQAIWLQVRNARPHAFFWIGANEPFAEFPLQFQAETYRRQRSVPFLQPLLHSIPQLAVWDAPVRMPDSELSDSRAIFERYWPTPRNAGSGGSQAYFTYNYGGVDFLFLDTYSYRDESGMTSILGKDQMAWLQRQLIRSEAPFKVLLSGCSWSNPPESGKNTWTADPEDLEGLFKYIRANDISGIVLISGDDDEAEIKAIPLSRDGGYDLYEIVSSPLAQEPSPDYSETSERVIAIEEPYAESMNFGTLTFDMTEDDPKATLQMINVFGESVFPEFELRASELRNGKVSWKSKAPPEAVAQIEAQAGSAL